MRRAENAASSACPAARLARVRPRMLAPATAMTAPTAKAPTADTTGAPPSSSALVRVLTSVTLLQEHSPSTILPRPHHDKATAQRIERHLGAVASSTGLRGERCTEWWA